VDWALQWVWNNPEVAVALSGMLPLNRLFENVESAERSVSGVFTEAELRLGPGA
jgi:predicted aldo/keto reductase-like oxidoreductase